MPSIPKVLRLPQATLPQGGTCALVILATAVLSCCSLPAPPPTAAFAGPAYVVLGSNAQAIARVVVDGAACPNLEVDGATLPMQTRVAAGTAPLRGKQEKASAFALQVCEATLPQGAHAASVLGRSLPLPRDQPRRIVVLGDTGCRIKKAENAYQDCSDSGAWPFAAVAAAAAREHPDLVLHVGDYHYRENPCPPDQRCAGSPWGYGWDAWDADFFTPAARLLAAAPWVMARGNHELCSRAGQGWFRLLDAAPYSARRNCDDIAADDLADFTAPYAVPLGDGWQLIIFDSARASRPLDRSRAPDAQTFDRYVADLDAVAALAAAPGMHSIFVSHHPALGFAIDAGAAPRFGTAALLEPMKQRNGTHYLPAGIEFSLHGHVHTFEAIDFASGQPAAIVAGHGGDLLDRDLAGPPAATYPGAEGIVIASAAQTSRFGYLVLERGAAGWHIDARGLDGALLAHCELGTRRVDCPAVAGGVHSLRPAAP